MITLQHSQFLFCTLIWQHVFDSAGTYTNIVKHRLIEYFFGDRVAQLDFADSPKSIRVS
jgi:hypothetical protein